jgi:hypothetical protein
MANEATLMKKRSHSGTVTAMGMSQDDYIMTRFVIKWPAEERFMTEEFLLTNAGILIK